MNYRMESQEEMGQDGVGRDQKVYGSEISLFLTIFRIKKKSFSKCLKG